MKGQFSVLQKLEHFSSSEFVSAFKPVFVRMFPDLFRIIKRHKDILHLQKFFSLEYVEVLSFPREILDLDEQKKQENLQQFQNEFLKSIEIFENVVSTKMPHFHLGNFSKNLETLLIQETPFIETGIEALYDHDLNMILLLVDIGIKHLYHELFHVASFRKSHDVISSGFMQFVEGNPQTLIGRGLTEGYTQILTERYFQDYNIAKKHYFHLMLFSSHLEMIVGKKRMESLYSNADLYHLIEDLEQYETKDHILAFLKNLDIIELLASRTKGEWDFQKGYCQSAIQNVLSFLVKCRTLQLKKEFQSGLINEHDLEVSVNSFLDSITSTDFKNLYGDIYEVNLSEDDMKLVDQILYDDVEQNNKRSM